MHTPYLFTSARLGFRNWQETDIDAMAAINADPEVMQFFPAPQDRAQTAAFIERMQEQLARKGFCYFAVDKMDDGSFIGFTGLSAQTFEAPFTPCIDIGWRLDKRCWGHGFATEGAIACMQYGFHTLHLDKLYAMAPKINLPSIRVMQKAGMQQVSEFMHPRLAGDERLQPCVLYEIASPL